jgi:hypothetical protein
MVMTVAELLAEGKAAGLHLAADGERLVVRGPKSAESLVRMILDRKAEILPLLRIGPPAHVTGIHTGTVPWDQAEADRLLADLNAYCARARPKPDPVWENVRVICLDVVMVAAEARDLEDLRGRCRWMEQIARGMPPAREWGNGTRNRQ